MGAFWNKDIKRIIMVMALTWIVGGVFTNLAIFRYQKRVSEAEYNAYANVLSVVKEAYPQAQEDEIIRNLSHVSEMSTGESILRQYGILRDGELYLGQSKVKRKVILWANGIFFVTMSASVVLLLLFWKGRNRKLRELGRYVDRVSHGEYELQLQKNQESYNKYMYALKLRTEAADHIGIENIRKSRLQRLEKERDEIERSFEKGKQVYPDFRLSLLVRLEA